MPRWPFRDHRGRSRRRGRSPAPDRRLELRTRGPNAPGASHVSVVPRPASRRRSGVGLEPLRHRRRRPGCLAPTVPIHSRLVPTGPLANPRAVIRRTCLAEVAERGCRRRGDVRPFHRVGADRAGGRGRHPRGERLLQGREPADNAVESAGEEPTPRQQRAVEASLTGIEETAPASSRPSWRRSRESSAHSLQARHRPVREPGAVDRHHLDRRVPVRAVRLRADRDGRPRVRVRAASRNGSSGGTVVIKFTNEGAELHELVLYRFKGDETIKGLLLGRARRRRRSGSSEVDSTMAEQGQSSYAFAKFDKTGRYFAAALPPGRRDQLRGARDRRRPTARGQGDGAAVPGDRVAHGRDPATASLSPG